ERPAEFAGLKAEFVLQRRQVRRGPRIAAMLSPLDPPFESGLTLIFADQRSSLGILVLRRTAELGSFTSTELRTLTLALDASSELLSDLRLLESTKGTLAQSFLEASLAPDEGSHVGSDPSMYVLDRDFEIIFAWTSEQGRDAGMTTLNMQTSAKHLPEILENAVRELTANWTADPTTQTPGTARPIPFVMVRTQPLSGPKGLCIGVLVDRSQPRNSLTSAADRYRISAREVQTLSLLLHGATLEEIATALSITPSTVQDHIKSLLEKTRSHSRTEMIAKIFGWQA
ncbi:MAG: helix-turn-helix domain-containing protein, partial [Vulcanimicrobiaceae bacterium]